MKSVFHEIYVFSILINFGNSDRLLEKLLLIQYLKKWVQYSTQDKLMMKKMAKAVKFHNRRVKFTIFKALREQMNTLSTS